MRMFLLTVMFATPLAAQALVQNPGIPPAALYANIGSHANDPGASLAVLAGFELEGVTYSGPIMTASNASTTFSWDLSNSAQGTHLVTAATLTAFPESPFVLAASVSPGPANAPGPWLPASMPIGQAGMLHLAQTAMPVIDGLGILGTATPGAHTDAQGEFLMQAPIPLHHPDHLSFQALVVDAAAPHGLRLTAAFTILKHQ